MSEVITREDLKAIFDEVLPVVDDYNDLENKPLLNTVDGIEKNKLLVQKADTIDLANVPVATVYKPLERMTDANGSKVGNMEAVHTDGDFAGVSFGATRTVNGNDVFNWATSYIGNDGTQKWGFSNPKPFREGLGLGDAFRYSYKSSSGWAFSANQSRSGLTQTVTSLDGYTALVYSAYCSSHSAIDVIDASVSGTTLTFWARNRTSDAISSATFGFRILYIKTLLFGSNVT